jgi:hypothetical protein
MLSLLEPLFPTESFCKIVPLLCNPTAPLLCNPTVPLLCNRHLKTAYLAAKLELEMSIHM